ncbi:MAG: DUF1648 domain-containing protein [Tissierellaceae bacterium]|nr:DUF1648 domain-containing protein [Tissierellaceae bacterium]
MKTETSTFQRIMELIGITIILVLIFHVITSYTSLPDKIPGHFNAQGEITRYGSKAEILIMPIFGILMYIGLTLIQINPKVWSVSSREDVETKVYHNLKSMIISLKVQLIGFFLYIAYNQIKGTNLSIDATIIFISIVLMTLVFFITRAYRKN